MVAVAIMPRMDWQQQLDQLKRRTAEVMCIDWAWSWRRLLQAKQQQLKGAAATTVVDTVSQRLQTSAEEVTLRRDRRPEIKLPEQLPISQHHTAIIEAIQQHPIVIIAGETGSGKTTQLPKLCLQAGRGVRGLIGCTQPRRIAAQAMAQRVAEELSSPLGTTVGFQVRFREKFSASGYIKFMTDGILLAETQTDRYLNAYDTLIIDEAHERSLNIDFLLGYLKQLQLKRPDLKIVITSATIDTEKFARHFDAAPVIEVSGRTYPVEMVYLPLETEQRRLDLNEGLLQAVRQLDRHDPAGDILAFFSGEREIREAKKYLEKQHLRQTEILPLYSRLAQAEQQRVFHPGSQRRIILATNVAETSLTVPRIRFVIDTGLARISRYAHRSAIQRLPIEPVSQASANQRAGRCGRLGPGICVRLYSEEDFFGRPEFTEPEILRTSLASVILQMAVMRLGGVETFPFLDRPAPRMVNAAYQQLLELNALDQQKQPTPLGRKLARWPLDVRLARMILAADTQAALQEAVVIVAFMSIQDPRERPLDAQQAADEEHARFVDKDSDFVGVLRLWDYLSKLRQKHSSNRFRKLCKREFIAAQRVFEWFDLVAQLRDQARQHKLHWNTQPAAYENVHRALLSGLLSHVGFKDPQAAGYLGARNRGFLIFPGSGLAGKAPRWLMAGEIVETSRAYGRINAAVKAEWIEQAAQHVLKRRVFDPFWSRRRGRVMAYEQVSLYGLILVEKRPVNYAGVDAEHAREIFIREALAKGELNSRATFLQTNRKRIEEVQALEQKRRRHDVLVDEQDLAAFFEPRIPASVYSARRFEKWWRGLKGSERRQLVFSHSLLMREDAGHTPASLFPDRLSLAGEKFSLRYRFSPGSGSDGVTLEVPLHLLNKLDNGQLQWLVPGLLREKLLELVKTLPKPIKRVVTPARQFVDALLEALAGKQNQALLPLAAQELARITGAAIESDSWDETAIPAHLRFYIEVRNDQGEVVRAGRDLEVLQQALGSSAQRSFMDKQGADYNVDHATDWVFGALPVSVKTTSGTSAWPALVSQDQGVGLRLFDTQVEAHNAHIAGLVRLVAFRLPDKIKYAQKRHGLTSQAQFAAARFSQTGELVNDMINMALQAQCAESGWTVRDTDGFANLVEGVRGELLPQLKVIADSLNALLPLYLQATRVLEKTVKPKFPEAYSDMRSQVDDLVYAGFLQDLRCANLQHYPRYFQALVDRLEKLLSDPAKDRQRMVLLAPHWQRYLNWLEQENPYSITLDIYRWLVEEFRVQLFAQHLGTHGKVSAKRLEKAWQKVQAE